MKNAMDITTGYLGIFAVKKSSYEENLFFWTAKKPNQNHATFKKSFKKLPPRTYQRKSCEYLPT